MKTKLKAHFLPPNYIQNNYTTLHNLTEGSLSVEEYTRKFEKLLIKCDLQEAEEQTRVRYLGGLESKYAHVVELQLCTNFDEVCVLAHKMETQMKNRPLKREFPKPLPKGQPFNKGSSSYPTKPVAPFTPNPQMNQAPQKSPTPQTRPNPTPTAQGSVLSAKDLGTLSRSVQTEGSSPWPNGRPTRRRRKKSIVPCAWWMKKRILWRRPMMGSCWC